MPATPLPGLKPGEAELRASQKSEAWIKEQPKKLRAFYSAQNRKVAAMLEALEITRSARGLGRGPANRVELSSGRSKVAVRLSFCANVVLFALKVAAALWSQSLSVIASTVDSLIDLLSGAIIYFSQLFSSSKNPYKYPQGKSRCEPIGVVFFAAAMAVASLQLVATGISQLSKDLSGAPHSLRFDWVAASVFSLTLTVKAALFLYCRLVFGRDRSVSVQALANDHFSDLVSNAAGLCFSAVSFYFPKLVFIDSAGMVLFGAVICFVWAKTAFKQMMNLLGRAAPSEFITKITFLAATFSPTVRQVEKVLAYHFGVRYLVEVDLVLPGDARLQRAHDVGEDLEVQIEAIDKVERAYVHLDHDTTHRPEHKIFY